MLGAKNAKKTNSRFKQKKPLEKKVTQSKVTQVSRHRILSEGISLCFLWKYAWTGEFKSTMLYSQYLGEYLLFLSLVFSVGKVLFKSAVFSATKIFKSLRWLVRAAKPIRSQICLISIPSISWLWNTPFALSASSFQFFENSFEVRCP